MGETLSLFRSSINKSLRIESRPERLTGEPGAMLLREIMERTRIIEWLTERLHDLRHWFAVDYLRRCGNIYALQKILGHASLTTTEIYLDHLDPEQQEYSKTRGAQKGAQGERF